MDRKNKRAGLLATRGDGQQLAFVQPNGGSPTKPMDAADDSRPRPTPATNAKGQDGFLPSKAVPSFAAVASGLSESMSPMPLSTAQRQWPSALADALNASRSPALENGRPTPVEPALVTQTDTSPRRHISPARASPPARPSPPETGHRDVFGTSPFSAPGSHSVFLSTSFDSEDGKYMSQRFGRSLGPQPLETRWHGVDDQDEDVHEEDCLPSSLSELLTHDEVQRQRERKAAHQHLVDTSLSRSVPLQTSFSFGPHVNGDYAAVGGLKASPLARANAKGHLSDGPLLASLGPNAYRTHPPGSSLPPYVVALATLTETDVAQRGLAAGLSRLHFLPAAHSGDTPPPSSNASAATPSPPSNYPAMPHLRPQPPLRSPYMHIVGSPLARTVSWQSTGNHSNFEAPERQAAPLSDDEDDTIPFAMDEA